MRIFKLDKRYTANKLFDMNYCIEEGSWIRNQSTITKLKSIAWELLMPSVIISSSGIKQTARYMQQYSWYVEYGLRDNRVYFRTREDMDKVLFMFGLKH